jgi:hypothetical protein
MVKLEWGYIVTQAEMQAGFNRKDREFKTVLAHCNNPFMAETLAEGASAKGFTGMGFEGPVKLADYPIGMEIEE